MDIRDGYEGFLRGIDKFRVSSVSPADFLYWYHIAQQDFIDQRLGYFELTGGMDDDLLKLSAKKEYPGIVAGEPADLPPDYYRTSLATCSFTFTNACGKAEAAKRRVLRLTGDKEGFILNNPFYSPNIERWYYRMMGGTVELYGSKDVSDNTLTLSYVREPPVFSVPDIVSAKQSIWKNDQMAKITQKAAALFLENKQSPRIASYPQVNKIDQL